MLESVPFGQSVRSRILFIKPGRASDGVSNSRISRLNSFLDEGKTANSIRYWMKVNLLTQFVPG